MYNRKKFFFTWVTFFNLFIWKKYFFWAILCPHLHHKNQKISSFFSFFWKLKLWNVLHKDRASLILLFHLTSKSSYFGKLNQTLTSPLMPEWLDKSKLLLMTYSRRYSYKLVVTKQLFNPVPVVFFLFTAE